MALGRAIQSILDQTFSALECVVVFEAGDPNYELIKGKFSDSRLVLVQRSEPRNRNACHNHGLSIARGRYIARMDGDDYSFPERLEREIAFLKSHDNVAVVGTAGRLLDSGGNVLGVRTFPLTHAAIMRSFMLTNPIFHPSVVWDTAVIGRDVAYHNEFYAEDLDMWFQMMERKAKFANLPDALIDYEMPPWYLRPKENWQTNFRVRLRHWRLCLTYPSLFIGLVCYALMSILPRRIINLVTRRSLFSDWLRSIRHA